MIHTIPVAWLQLKRERIRTTVAVAGVAVAVILIFMQLGFRDALFGSAVRIHSALQYDLAMVNPRTRYLVRPEGFSRRRLYQVLGFAEVENVSAVYVGLTSWRDPEARDRTRPIFIMGFDPSDAVFDLAGVIESQERLRLPDVVLFDERSRPEFGRIATLLREGDAVRTEVGRRSVSVEGLFRLGTSFGVDGSLITSDLNFLRIFAERAPGRIDLGLIRLAPGVDPQAARATIAADLPDDVDILTRDAFVAREIGHWKRATPVGYVFGFGAAVGLLVGSIVVYQILFTDVNDHIREYATLKAMGHRDRFLFGIVIQQAALLAALGFSVGTVIATVLYRIAGDATRLPMQMEISRSLMVFAFTVAMCCIAGAAALVRVRSADPAEVF